MRVAWLAVFALVACAPKPPSVIEVPVAQPVAAPSAEPPPTSSPPLVDPTLDVLAPPPPPLGECARDSDCVVSTFKACVAVRKRSPR